jgi:hypothetical protein
MDVNKQTSVEEVQNRSDMVELLDGTLNELDNKRYVLVVTITKKGGVYVDGAGFVSELELTGLKIAIPSALDDIACEMFCGNCLNNEEEEG